MQDFLSKLLLFVHLGYGFKPHDLKGQKLNGFRKSIKIAFQRYQVVSKSSLLSYKLSCHFEVLDFKQRKTFKFNKKQKTVHEKSKPFSSLAHESL